MLVLARKKDEAILIGNEVEIIVTEISEDKVKIGIKAPKHMKVFRKELLEQVKEENLQSAESKVDLKALAKAIKK